MNWLSILGPVRLPPGLLTPIVLGIGLLFDSCITAKTNRVPATEYESHMEGIMERSIQGFVSWDDNGYPIAYAIVQVIDIRSSEAMAEGETDEKGTFYTGWQDRISEEDTDCYSEVFVTIYNRDRRLLLSTQDNPIRITTTELTLPLTIPGRLRDEHPKRPTIQVGSLQLDAEAVMNAEPELVLDIARAMVDPEYEARMLGLLNGSPSYLRNLSPACIFVGHSAEPLSSRLLRH
jgi:hypothetical protein